MQQFCANPSIYNGCVFCHFTAAASKACELTRVKLLEAEAKISALEAASDEARRGEAGMCDHCYKFVDSLMNI